MVKVLIDQGGTGPIRDADHAARLMRDLAANAAHIKRVVREFDEHAAELGERCAEVIMEAQARVEELNAEIQRWHRERYVAGDLGLKHDMLYGESGLGNFMTGGTVEIRDVDGTPGEKIVKEWAKLHGHDVLLPAKEPGVSKELLRGIAAEPANAEPGTERPMVTEDGEVIPGAFHVWPARKYTLKVKS